MEMTLDFVQQTLILWMVASHNQCV